MRISPARRVRRGAIAAAALLLAACGQHGKSITVNREVFISGVSPRVDAIARTHDGGFVVTGAGTAAWAVATDPDGVVLWKFADPVDNSGDSGSQSIPQSEFHGAVAMATGSILLCGGRYKNGHTRSELLILARDGAVVERRAEVPNNESRFVHSNFYRCFAWRDEILLLGNANDGLHGFIWIVELDGDGVEKRQVLLNNAPVTSAGSTDKPSFVFTAWDSDENFRIVRVDPNGEVLAKRVIAGDYIVQLRPTVESTQTAFIVSRGGESFLYRLNEKLNDAQPPGTIAGFDVSAGCGYVLADESIALFGRWPSAAVAWIRGQDRSYTLRSLDSKYASSSVSDAVPVSIDEFVTVRGGVGGDPKQEGLVMSWVTIRNSR